MEHDEAVSVILVAKRRSLARPGSAPASLDGWIDRARTSDLHCLRQFAITLKKDIEAVRNAILERWSNAQTRADPQAQDAETGRCMAVRVSPSCGRE